MSLPQRNIPNLFPRRSRKPGGRHREGQRSGSRRVPAPTVPVDPYAALKLLQLRWRSKHEFTSLWRLRSLAAVGVALAVPRGMSSVAMCNLREHQVRALPMPPSAMHWVTRWLDLRGGMLGPSRGSLPWLAIPGSRGLPRQVGWSITMAFTRAGLPGWRLGALVRAEWPQHLLRSERRTSAAAGPTSWG